MHAWQTPPYAMAPTLASVDGLLRLQRSDARLELALRLHACMSRVAAPLATARRAALREALQLLLDWNVQAAVTASSSSTTQNSSHDDSTTGASSRVAVTTPYDAIRVDVMGARDDGDGAWEEAQRALCARDHVAELLDVAWLPLREEVRVCMRARKPAKVAFAHDTQALQWCSLPPSSSPPSAQTTGQTRVVDAAAQRRLTAVTLREQELTLRVLQGLCLCARHQRSCVVRSAFFYLAAQTLQCLLLHLDAARRHRRMHARNNIDDNNNDNNKVTEGDALHRHGANAHTATSVAQLRVLLAMVDALEAACHYHPDALDELVKSGALHAMLDIAYAPYSPTPLRARVLSLVCVLRQQVAALLLTQSPSTSSAAAAATTRVDANNGSNGARQSLAAAAADERQLLLQAMLTHAVTGMTPNMSHHFPTFTLRRNSAVRLDMHVTDWLTRRGLLHLLPAITHLHDDDDDNSRLHSRNVADDNDDTRLPSPQHSHLLQRAQQLCQRRLVALLHAMDGRQATLS